MSQRPHEKEELEDFWEKNKATYGKETSRAILNIRDDYEKTLGLSFRKWPIIMADEKSAHESYFSKARPDTNLNSMVKSIPLSKIKSHSNGI